MTLRSAQLFTIALLALSLVGGAFAQTEFAEFESDSSRPRWMLSVEVHTFDHVKVTDPLGRKATYWYVTYTLSNKTNEVSERTAEFFQELDGDADFGVPVDVRMSVYLIVDVPEGVHNKEKLQNLFVKCELPGDLETLTMDDMVNEERARSGLATEDWRERGSDDVHRLQTAMHERNMRLVNHLEQVRREADTYYYSRSQWMSWFKHYTEGSYPDAKGALEDLYNRELLDASQFITRLDPPQRVRIGEGDSARTLELKFKPLQLAPGESRECVAIFPDISPEADYIGVMFDGLVDPVVREDDWKRADGFEQRSYVERKASLHCFSRLGDEFKRDQDTVHYLGNKWVVTERYPVDYGREEFISREADRVPPQRFSRAADEGPEPDQHRETAEDPNSLRKRNEHLVED